MANIPCTNNCGPQTHIAGSGEAIACQAKGNRQTTQHSVSITPPSHSKIGSDVKNRLNEIKKRGVDLSTIDYNDPGLSTSQSQHYIRKNWEHEDMIALNSSIQEWRVESAYEDARYIAKNDLKREISDEELHHIADFLLENDQSDMLSDLANVSDTVPLTIELNGGEHLYSSEIVGDDSDEVISPQNLRNAIIQQGLDIDISDEQLQEICDNTTYDGVPTVRFFTNVKTAQDILNDGGTFTVNECQFGMVDGMHGSGYMVEIYEPFKMNLDEKDETITVESENSGYNWSDISNDFNGNDAITF